MNEVEVALREPGRTTVIRVTDGYRARRRILADVSPLPMTEDVSILKRRGVSRIWTTNFHGSGHRATLVSNLEQTERCGHPLPRQGVVGIAFEAVRTIGRQWSSVGFALVREVVEGLVERTGRVRGGAPRNTAVDLVGSGQAGVVAPQAAVGIAEHSRPALARGLGHPEFDPIVVANRRRIVRTTRTGTERSVLVEYLGWVAKCRADTVQVVCITVDRFVDAFAGVHDGVHLGPSRVPQGSIFNDMVQTFAVITGFERQVMSQLVVGACDELMLTIRLHARRDRFPGTKIVVFDQLRPGFAIRQNSRSRTAGEIGLCGGRAVRAGPVIHECRGDIRGREPTA